MSCRARLASYEGKLLEGLRVCLCNLAQSIQKPDRDSLELDMHYEEP